MPSTAMPAVKAAIVEAIEGADELEGVVVSTLREPVDAEDYVWLRFATARRDFKVIGPVPSQLEETVRVVLRIVAIRQTSEEAEARAGELAELIEAVLRDAEIGPPVLYPLLVEELDEQPLEFDRKRGHDFVMTVITKARI